MKFRVTVERQEWSEAEFDVEADNEAKAEELALAEAGDHDFGSGNAECEVKDVMKLESDPSVPSVPSGSGNAEHSVADPEELSEVYLAYENGECPDCGGDIPTDAVEGQTCTNCGHAFFLQRVEDNNKAPSGSNFKDGVEYGCHCDLEDGNRPEGCVIDDPKYAGPQDCIYAKPLVAEGNTKWNCQYWQPIRTPIMSKEDIIAATITLMDNLRVHEDPININLIMELENCLARHGICYKCGQSFAVHNGDGSCIED